ncbi:MAG TPA: hypothetical protein VER96_38800 [Polyangiaceae bacterium]|nr:hypothetical protein [Polyangiaceae bacterium]
MSRRCRRAESLARGNSAVWHQAPLAALSICLLTSCTIALNRDRHQCGTSADCQALSPGAVCTSDGLCESVQPFSPRDANACRLDADCNDLWSVCRKGSCKPLSIENCQRLDDELADAHDRLLIGALLPQEDLEKERALDAIRLALKEINRAARSIPELPGVVGLACDETNSGALSTLLDDFAVPLLVSPTRLDPLAHARARNAQRAVIFAPFADAPNLRDGVPEASDAALISCRPNRADLSEALLNGVDFAKRRAIAQGLLPKEAPTVLTFSKLEENLGFDRPFTVHTPEDAQIISYDPETDNSSLASALTKASIRSGLLVATSGEVDWSKNRLDDVDAALDNAPLYLLSDQQPGLLDVVTHDMSLKKIVPRYERLWGLDLAIDATLHTRFAAAFLDEFQARPSPNLDSVNDCVYLAVYSALAAQIRFALTPRQLTPSAIVTGLRALVGGDPEFSVGAPDIADVVAALQQNGGTDDSLRLARSTNGFEWLGLPSPSQAISNGVGGLYVRPHATSLELYCTTTADFCRTGLRFSAESGPRDDAESQCSCLTQ